MMNVARSAGALLLGLALVGACHSKSGARTGAETLPAVAKASVGAVAAPDPATFQPGNVGRGKALVAEFECNRCHAGTGLAAPKLDRDCVGCHEQIAHHRYL